MEQAWKFYGKIKRAFSLTFAKSNEKSLFLHLICAFSQIILQFAYFSGIIDLIAKRNVAFVNRSATIVSETQVCKFKCTVCKRNASFVSEMHHL